ncbi:MAG: hypothetical protein A4S09_07725 [Proteobacteria bacterium SG_bin7]|nr:MAG: hypothetical protein A4S09_07725 [Proteobacteria bacterium SG_bin7]
MFNLKKLQRRKLFYLLFCILTSQFALAHEPGVGEGRMTIGAMSNRFIDSPAPIKTPTTFGAGITGELDIGGRGGIEVSMFYYDGQYAVSKGGLWLVERSTHLYIPIGYRYWLSKKISFATSFYASFRIGQWTEIYRDTGISSDAVTSAQDITEYGFDFSIGADLYTGDKYTLILDSRYLLPTTDKPDENSRAYVFFLGIKYRIH